MVKKRYLITALVITALGMPAAVLHAEESSVSFTSADKDSGKIVAYLDKPDSGSGPYPAVVIMHGGGGVHRWTTKFASTISDWGYVTLVIDTYGSRNIRSTREIGSEKGAFHQIARMTAITPSRKSSAETCGPTNSVRR